MNQVHTSERSSRDFLNVTRTTAPALGFECRQLDLSVCSQLPSSTMALPSQKWIRLNPYSKIFHAK